MRRAIATVSLSGTLREKLEAIAAARFDAVEIFENDLIGFNGTPRDVRAMADDLGLGIDLYQPFRDFEGVRDAALPRNLDRALRKFDVMAELGAPMILVCSNVSRHAIADDARSAAQLRTLAEHAAKRNLRIGFEALAWGTHVNTVGHSWKIVREADHPHLGVVVDSFHILSRGDAPERVAEIPGEKIFFLQLADAPLMAMDILQWSRHFRCFPGQGQFDLPRFLEQVLLAGYTGPLSLEVFNDLFREAPARRTANDAYQSLLWLEEQTRLRLQSPAGATDGGGEARSRVLHRVELFNPPAVPALEGTTFLEFAVAGAAQGALEGVLRALGFRRQGRHKSKAVTLFRQGDISLILNAESDSFAEAYFRDHGPSICAIGLSSEDSVQAHNRAIAFHATRFDSRVGPNELRIPAVRSPGGSLFYFVPADVGSKGLYEIDFTPTAEADDASRDAGLATVDHCALGMSIDELDSWVLFHRVVFGMEPGDSLELTDPYGLVRIRGMATPNRKLRTVLNVSMSARTLTARTVSTLAGASVHHVAFACVDIFATVAKLRANGVRFVPISSNYYADLPTRFEMDEALVKKLEAAGVLYDRSDAGEYFHIYSEMFAERFFFEIVQRVGAYDGYGAANAPARMAAQAQRAAG